MDNPLAKNLQRIQQQMKQSAMLSKDDSFAIQLLAVSKHQSAGALRLLANAGQRLFAENYLQEALKKQAELVDLDLEWHFIGHIQRNKTRDIATHFDWAQGVDREIIAQRLSQQRPQQLNPLNICIQVNIDQVENKHGCAPEQVAELVTQISPLENIRLRGLMIIPEPDNKNAFSAAHALFTAAKSVHVHPKDWDTLSMGMSSDFEAAIQNGATMIRIGTALFGQRKP